MRRWDDHTRFGAVDESPLCDWAAGLLAELVLFGLAVLCAVIAAVAVIG